MVQSSGLHWTESLLYGISVHFLAGNCDSEFVQKVEVSLNPSPQTLLRGPRQAFDLQPGPNTSSFPLTLTLGPQPWIPELGPASDLLPGPNHVQSGA